MSGAALELEVITAALKEQLAGNVDTFTLIETIVSLSKVIERRAPNAAVRAAADGLKVRVLKLSKANDVPRFVVRDMLEDFIEQIERRAYCASV